jgi:hypothetical protein
MTIEDLKSDDICLDCHDRPESSGSHTANNMESKICIDCHSPHASRFEYLLIE